MTDAALTKELKERARALDFARAGVASADALEPEGAQLAAWLADGRHGSMRWMADTAEVRRDPRHPGMLPTARSVLVLAAPYARKETPRGPVPGRIARYAQGRDYHNVLRRRMRKLEAFLREAGHDARASVDTLPVFERAWAERAGVGFVGKNCCVIVPGLGSHVFLACVVTSADLVADAPMARRCGRCTACLDACPTDAFAGARELDARRCISYLTIEHDGPIDPSLRPGMGAWMLGCDVCQDVCPYNRTAPTPPEMTEPYAAHARWDEADAEAILAMDEASYRAWAQGSPAMRPGVERMARNAAIALGNAGARRHLPVLQGAAEGHESATVREAAAWAAARLAGRTS